MSYALLEAVEKGDMETIKELYRRRWFHTPPDPNYGYKDGDTALMIACEKGYPEIAKLLIQEGASVHTKVKKDQTALIYASQEGHADIVEMLINAGAKVDEKAYYGETALMYACKNGHIGVAQILLSHGASTKGKEKVDETPLSLASENGHAKIIDLLVSYGVDVNKRRDNYNPVIALAAEKGHTAAVQSLINAGANVDGDGWYGIPLVDACLYGYYDTAQLLIKNGADVNIRTRQTGTTPLCAAAECGDIKIAKMVIKNGADIVEKALLGACYCGKTEMAEFLIDNGLDMNLKNHHGIPLIIVAVEEGHTGTVDMLAKKGADVNAQDENGYTALMTARQKEDIETVKVLLAHGADVAKENKWGETVKDHLDKFDHEGIRQVIEDHEKRLELLVIEEIPNMIPAEIMTIKDSELYNEIIKNDLLAECFEGLDYERQNALLVACWDDIAANEELNQKIQQAMQESLNKEQGGKLDVGQIKLFNIIEANTINVKA